MNCVPKTSIFENKKCSTVNCHSPRVSTMTRVQRCSSLLRQSPSPVAGRVAQASNVCLRLAAPASTTAPLRCPVFIKLPKALTKASHLSRDLGLLWLLGLIIMSANQVRVSVPGSCSAAPAAALTVHPATSSGTALAPIWVAPSHAAADASSSDVFSMDGLPVSFFRELIDANGGDAAFEAMTTSDVKRNIIVPQTQGTMLSMCAQMRQEGREFRQRHGS